jgi:peptidase M28-like protein
LVAGARRPIEALLAGSREAGTPAAEAARRVATRHLEALGYRVTAQPFRFHPSGLLGFPLLGAGLVLSALLVTPLLVLPDVPGWGALAVWLAGAGGSVLLGLGVGLARLPLGESREDANLIAARGDGPVTRWIVAHLDTKAQVQSMAGRLVAVWVAGLAAAVLTALAVGRLAGPLPWWLALLGLLLGLAGGTLAGRGRLRGASVGARDNGSGVAAALALAEACRDPATGICLTGAEEFGMVGARVFARSLGAGASAVEVVNFDTLDQEGDLYLVAHDAAGAAMAAQLEPRLRGLGPRVRRRRLPVGILVDSLPLAHAGARAVTVGRLTWRTLRLIHTPADRAEGLSLELAEAVGRALASN